MKKKHEEKETKYKRRKKKTSYPWQKRGSRKIKKIISKKKNQKAKTQKGKVESL